MANAAPPAPAPGSLAADGQDSGDRPTGTADPALRIGSLAAGALPLLFFIAALPPFAYFGQAARLLEESIGLQHSATPLSSLIAAIGVRVPIGPLALRVGIALAVAAAVASAALFVSLLHLLRELGVERDEVSVPLALGSCCVAFGHEPLWSRVMHGDPQLVGIALTCLLLERASAPGEARQRAPTVALLLGLLFAHDPRWALCMVALLWWTLRSALVQTALPLLFAVGAAPALYPLLRGAADQTTMAAQGVELTLTLPHQILLGAAAIFPLTALRSAGPRRALIVILAGLALPAVLVAEPTRTGAGLGGLAVLALATLSLGLVARDRGAPRPGLPVAVALAWLTFGVVNLRHTSMANGMAGFDTSAVLQQYAAEHLPPRSIVLWPETRAYSDAAGYRRESGARPDVIMVPMSHAKDPAASEAIAARTPALRGLLRDQLLHGKLGSGPLQTLATQSPVAIDLPARDLTDLAETLLPSGGLLRVVADGATKRDQQIATEQQQQYYARIYENIELRHLDSPARSLLLALHKRDALVAMHFGDRAGALACLELAQGLSEKDPEVAKMRSTLGPVDGPDWHKSVDIAPLAGPSQQP